MDARLLSMLGGPRAPEHCSLARLVGPRGHGQLSAQFFLATPTKANLLNFPPLENGKPTFPLLVS